MRPSSPPTGVLSPSERDIIARARAQRDEEHVPRAVRERLLSRALAEAQRAESPVPRVGALVPVRSRGAARALVATLAMAAAVVLLSRPGERGGPSPAGGQEAAGASDARRLGGRFFQPELFHAPAAAYTGPLPATSTNLFGEVPFAPQSAWQARRWNDLTAEPTGPADTEHQGNALCFRLGSGERVVAGWPWLPAAEAAADGVGSRRPRAPAPVALEKGQSYHLVFKAWASEPLPEQVLVAVGHARIPFSGAGGARVEVTTAPAAYVIDIAPRHDDPSVGVALLASSAPSSAPSRLCVSDVTLHAVTAR